LIVPIAFEALLKPPEHPAHSIQLVIRWQKVGGGEIAQPTCELYLCIEFPARTERDTHMVAVCVIRVWRPSIVSFRDVRRNRHSRSPGLRRQSEAFIGWKALRDRVTIKDQIDSDLPDLEIPVAVDLPHVALPAQKLPPPFRLELAVVAIPCRELAYLRVWLTRAGE
jgi:hypothetical protein